MHKWIKPNRNMHKLTCTNSTTSQGRGRRCGLRVQTYTRWKTFFSGGGRLVPHTSPIPLLYYCRGLTSLCVIDLLTRTSMVMQHGSFVWLHQQKACTCIFWWYKGKTQRTEKRPAEQSACASWPYRKLHKRAQYWSQNAETETNHPSW